MFPVPFSGKICPVSPVGKVRGIADRVWHTPLPFVWFRYHFGAVFNAPVHAFSRIGVRFRLPAEMNQVAYFGRGPEENYIDRKAGTIVDLYKTTADDMYFPYVRPQENGHHVDTRWVALSKKGGKGLRITADKTFGFNALRNSVEDFDSEEATNRPRQWNNFSAEEIANRSEAKAKNVLRRQTHINDITPRDFVEVCIDMQQQGVGGYDSWGAWPEKWALINPNQSYSWGFTITPLK